MALIVKTPETAKAKYRATQNSKQNLKLKNGKDFNRNGIKGKFNRNK